MTTFFNLFTRPYNDIGVSNFVKVALYKTTSPLAIFASLTSEDPGPLDASTWSFPGLDRTNYICKIFEVTGSGDIVRQLEGDFTFIPTSSKFSLKAPMWVVIGETEIPGLEPDVFPADVDTVIVPDWIGATPKIEKRGIGTQKKDTEYSFDAATGEWALLITDDIFENGVWYYIEFEPIIVDDESTNQYYVPFQETLIITTTTTLTSADIGKKILVKSASAYLEITLPDIETVVENRIAFFEFCQGTLKCCKIKTFTGNIIDWLKKGDSDRNFIHGCPGETLELFREIVDEENSVWRKHNADGNFRNVGHRVSDDQVSTDVINKLILDGGGSTGVSSTEFARLYEDYVLYLPPAQVVSYANWSTGNNKYLYSLKDNATGKFRIPDLRNKFMRVTDGTRTAGDFQAHAMQNHRHLIAKNTDSEGLLTKLKKLFAKKDNGQTNGYILGGGDGEPDVLQTGKMVDDNGDALTLNIGTETRPDNVAENYYVLV